jgi:pimeloyl-ACP methyl ester carboxylesterase
MIARGHNLNELESKIGEVDLIAFFVWLTTILPPMVVLAAAIMAGNASAKDVNDPKNAGDPVVRELGAGFESGTAQVNGTSIHYVRGGAGPALILVHGFPQDWYEYHSIMPRLAKRFTVVAVDLRGISASKATPSGYDAANMAEDVHQLVAALKLDHVYIVGHDIGGMLTYAFVRRYPEITRGAMILDVPIPGIAGWDEILGDPSVWHIHFMQVPGLAEKLLAGRSSYFLGYFFNFGKFTPNEKAHYVKAYAAPAQIRAALEIYRAFPANAKFNAEQRGPNDVPLFLAAGDGSSFAKLIPKMAEALRANGCAHVETGSIPGSVHYVVNDQPDAVAELIERNAQ